MLYARTDQANARKRECVCPAGSAGATGLTDVATLPTTVARIIAVRMQRHGQVIRVRADQFEEYKRRHAAVPPRVLAMIRECNLQNYSIFHKDGWLFTYFEYTGSNFAADMAKMAADPATREWWNVVGPMQQPLDSRAPGEWWAEMDPVFHFQA
jgi:L-rhamnose mutarotase